MFSFLLQDKKGHFPVRFLVVSNFEKIPFDKNPVEKKTNPFTKRTTSQKTSQDLPSSFLLAFLLVFSLV